LGTHLRNAQQSYSDSDKLFEKARSTLENMLGARAGDALPEPSAAALALPPEASAKTSA